MEEAKEIKFEIIRKYGVLSDNGRGWRKEFNLVAWNDRDPKLDIRDWNEDHSRMGKGLTFSREEAIKLYELLGDYLKR
jgi:hypothetical protein